MAFNIITAVAQTLNTDMIGRIGQTLGLDRASTLKAVAAAVPAILGGFAATASKPEGARQLSDALSAQDPTLLGQLGGMFVIGLAVAQCFRRAHGGVKENFRHAIGHLF